MNRFTEAGQIHLKEEWKRLISASKQKELTLIELSAAIAIIAIPAIIADEQGTARFPHKKQYFPRPYAAAAVSC
jgi:hypothetical protein